MKQNWANKTLADVISPAKVCKNTRGEDYPILSITMRSGIVFQKDRFSKQIASVDTSTYKVVNNGQLVIAFPIDEGLIYTQDIVEKGIMSPAYNIWDVDYSNLDRRFLVTYLHSDFAMNYYKSKLKGTTQRRRALPKDDLLSMPLPVPPLTTQQSIVSELDTLSQIIADYKEQLADYDKLEQSIFYDMFGDPVKNEKGWEVKTIGDVCRLKSGNSNANNSKSGDLPYVKVSDMNMKENEDAITISSTYVDRNENKNSIFPIGTTIFPKRGGAIFTNKKRITKVEICCDLNTMGVIPQKEVMPIYIYQFFRNFDLSTLCNGAAIPQLNNCDVNPIKLCVPPLPLQQQFASKIESIEQMKADTKAALQDAELLFQSRMDYWFNA